MCVPVSVVSGMHRALRYDRGLVARLAAFGQNPFHSDYRSGQRSLGRDSRPAAVTFRRNGRGSAGCDCSAGGSGCGGLRGGGQDGRIGSPICAAPRQAAFLPPPRRHLATCALMRGHTRAAKPLVHAPRSRTCKGTHRQEGARQAHTPARTAARASRWYYTAPAVRGGPWRWRRPVLVSIAALARARAVAQAQGYVVAARRISAASWLAAAAH